MTKLQQAILDIDRIITEPHRFDEQAVKFANDLRVFLQTRGYLTAKQIDAIDRIMFVFQDPFDGYEAWAGMPTP